jgi:hypothetical protein
MNCTNNYVFSTPSGSPNLGGLLGHSALCPYRNTPILPSGKDHQMGVAPLDSPIAA